ncbi:CHAT domain-containing protein [Micromonospora sp. WMMD1155]|uniref:CHAT domain-containing protein n=1 Tax=Micromonospora sp. WMMD1155 TaxID=3016094 RepID=UPI00249B16FD|nr:CHAT domain-containing protein [Micromonospora sp. WMMD1155]WFE52887.1 CHAT domain-containing protein [Micromonospora sp. WMMD1155]
MATDGGLSSAVRRVLARDDVMMLARDAEVAVDIMREGMPEEHVFRQESELFSEALKTYCDTARNATDDRFSSATFLDSLDSAGTIVRLCALLRVPLRTPKGVDVATLHEQALARLEADSETLAGVDLDKDLYRGRTIRYRAARDRRIRGDRHGAMTLADRPDSEFVGSGADIFRAYFHYELAAGHLLENEGAQVRRLLRESESRGYWKAVQDSQFVSRHRIDYAYALGAWAEGDRDDATKRLARAHRHLRRTGGRAPQYDIEDLLLSMTRAELLIDEDQLPLAAVNQAIDHLDDALHTIEGIRDRWRVISRSGSPLAAAIRRVYGDIARAAAMLPGRQAAELGLRVSLSAKQSGFASRVRADRFDVETNWRTWRTGRRLRTLLDQVVEAESGQQLGAADAENEKLLQELRQRIEHAVSPLLADAVVPVPVNVARLIDAVGDRYALDYVGLPDTVTAETSWFRTLIEPTGVISFGRLQVGDVLSAFITAISAPTVSLADALAGGVDWQALGEQLLPPQLRDVLQLTEEPVPLVISAHSALSLMPWAALRVDPHTHLVERAILTQTPVLTFLSGPTAATAAGPALIQLVGDRAGGSRELGIEREGAAWGLAPPERGSLPLSECELEPGAPPVEVPGTLASALSERSGRWRYVHIASHGEGVGLGQTLLLPDAPISAGRALMLRWPQSLLIASCQVGRLVNVEHAEPLNFVMATLAGGAEQVVACIDDVADYSASKTAAAMVRESRTNGTRLDVALREVQLEWVRRRWPDLAWILFAAYAR